MIVSSVTELLFNFVDCLEHSLLQVFSSLSLMGCTACFGCVQVNCTQACKKKNAIHISGWLLNLSCTFVTK